MTIALIALGSNLGAREDVLGRAVERLREAPGVDHVVASRWFTTAPVGGPPGQSAFLNGAARINTSLSADELHARLKGLERELGRVPGQRWGPRVIDLDLLLHGDERVTTPELQVPHPRMAVRRFVLEPAAEVAPDIVHPEIGWTVGQLWAHLLTAPPFVALAGARPQARAEILRRLVERGAARELSEAPLTPAQQAEALATLKLTTQDPWVVSDFWLDETSDTLPPKLVIVLDDGQFGTQEIERRARRPGRGPTLTVDVTDPERAVDEIAAALESMRP